MADRVLPMKMESPTSGGTETDYFPIELNPNEDGPSCRAIFLQNDSSDDSNIEITRDASDPDNMTFKDEVNTTPVTLTELLSGSGGLTESSHKALNQLIHFINDGPADGFASGAYRETTGTIFPTNRTWYTTSGKTQKIVERNITWSGVNPTVDEWKMYDNSGTLSVTVSDAISYSGIFETSRTRTITVH